MAEQPKLQLGEPPAGLRQRQKSERGVWMLGLLQLITLAAIGLLLSGRGQGVGQSAADRHRIEESRATAIALEQRSLAAEAASAWRDYLRQAPDAGDRAEVLYRIGGLQMDAHDYSKAVSALIEAEQLTGDDNAMEARIGPKIVECLRRLGEYGEVGRELSRQVEVGAADTAQGEVLATFAGESFTAADLDRAIQRTVDRALAMQPGGALGFGREQLLKQYESREARQAMLQEIVERELFSRRARELRIDREDAFRETRQYVETQLLASQFLTRELAKIQPTEVDIESYYSANQALYRTPETASVVVLTLQDEQSSAAVLAEINSAADFRSRAAAASGDAEASPLRIEAGEPHSRLGDTSALFELAAGQWTKVPLSVEGQQYLVLVESKTPAATPPLPEIRIRVESDYRRRKQRELTQQLGQELMDRYDVEITALPAERDRPEASGTTGPPPSAGREDAE